MVTSPGACEQHRGTCPSPYTNYSIIVAGRRWLRRDSHCLEETPTAQAMATVSYWRGRSLPVVSHHGIADPFHAPSTRGLLHDDVGLEETPTAMALEETPTAMALAG